MSRPLISVCLNTYRRPMVYDCLQSIQSQVLPPEVSLEIVISDNDADGSGREHVDRFRSEGGLPVSYAVVPEKNIAVARNDALRRAQGDWIAFIDDDETADSNWLNTLYTYALETGADVVLGSVKAHYHAGAPSWFVRADPMSKCWGPKGTRMFTGSTCNAFVRRAALDRLDGYFDPTLGIVGGDDADLFARLARTGAVILMCPDARVFEDTPPARTTLDYQRRRALRVGQTYARIMLKSRTPAAAAWFYANAWIRWVVLAVSTPVIRPFRRDVGLRLQIISWRNAGKIRELLGREIVQMY
ncbi:MAG: hypothetical protein AMXMBFR84_06530 [Candidatus Hydrogenedentota bacterium]